MRRVLLVVTIISLEGCINSGSENSSKFLNAHKVSISESDLEVAPDDATTIVLPQFTKENSFFLSDVIDSIRYVPLETVKESIIYYIERIICFDDKIFILDQFGKSMLIFDDKGRFLKRVGRVGKGPGEYINPISFTLNEDTHEILLLDDKGNKIIYYDFNGIFLRERRVQFRLGEFEFINDSVYVVNTDTRSNIHLPLIGDRKIFYIDTAWSNILVRGFPYDPNTEQELTSARRSITRFGNELIYNPSFSYDVYNLTSEGANRKYLIDAGAMELPKGFNVNLSTDRFLQTYDNENSEYAYISNVVLETGRHLITTLSYKKQYVYFFYCKSSGRLICSPFYKNDLWHRVFKLYPAKAVDSNELIAIVDPLQILYQKETWKEAGVEAAIPNDIKGLTESIDKNDNPVLAFYTLKEF